MRIHCAKCGLEWVIKKGERGEMSELEYDLFRHAAGCPKCKGIVEDSVSKRNILFFETDVMKRVCDDYDMWFPHDNQYVWKD